jgi:hypothetical protein
VHLQSATLKYRLVGGVSDFTLFGGVNYGQPSAAGAGFYDGSTLMAQASEKDEVVANIRGAAAVAGLGMAAAGLSMAADAARTNADTQMMLASSMSRSTTPTYQYVPSLPKPTAYEHARNFRLRSVPPISYNMPSSSLPLIRSSGTSSRIPTYSSSSTSTRIPMLSSSPLPTYSRTPTYSPSNNMGLSSGLPTRSGQLSGSTFYHANGTTSTRVNDTWYHPGGKTSTRIGDTVYHSDRTTSTKAGDTWYHSNGKTSTKHGNTIYNSDRTSYTITPDGTMYLNGKGL